MFTVDPTEEFVFVVSARQARGWAIHIKQDVAQPASRANTAFDYVCEFSTSRPVLSLCVDQSTQSGDIAQEDRTLQL
jgi:hypothetical protein